LITSPANPSIKAAAALHSKAERDRTDTFLVEGLVEIERAIEAGIEILTLFVNTGLRPRNLTESTKVIGVGADAYARIAYGRDGLVAVGIRPGFGLQDFHPTTPALILVAESIEKPGNLGAMLRTVDATGAALIAADPRTDLTNPNVVRASLGALFTVPIAQGTTAAAIDHLNRIRVPIVVTTVEEGVAPWELDLRQPVAVAIGREDRGLSEPWIDAAAQRVRLPMAGTIDSLNASVTAALVLYEAVRQRL
jgi:TrmH family RNA methyltransferase